MDQLQIGDRKNLNIQNNLNIQGFQNDQNNGNNQVLQPNVNNLINQALQNNQNNGNNQALQNNPAGPGNVRGGQGAGQVDKTSQVRKGIQGILDNEKYQNYLPKRITDRKPTSQEEAEYAQVQKDRELINIYLRHSSSYHFNSSQRIKLEFYQGRFLSQLLLNNRRFKKDSDLMEKVKTEIADVERSISENLSGANEEDYLSKIVSMKCKYWEAIAACQNYLSKKGKPSTTKGIERMQLVSEKMRHMLCEFNNLNIAEQLVRRCTLSPKDTKTFAELIMKAEKYNVNHTTYTDKEMEEYNNKDKQNVIITDKEIEKYYNEVTEATYFIFDTMPTDLKDIMTDEVKLLYDALTNDRSSWALVEDYQKGGGGIDDANQEKRREWAADFLFKIYETMKQFKKGERTSATVFVGNNVFTIYQTEDDTLEFSMTYEDKKAGSVTIKQWKTEKKAKRVVKDLAIGFLSRPELFGEARIGEMIGKMLQEKDADKDVVTDISRAYLKCMLKVDLNQLAEVPDALLFNMARAIYYSEKNNNTIDGFQKFIKETYGGNGAESNKQSEKILAIKQAIDTTERAKAELARSEAEERKKLFPSGANGNETLGELVIRRGIITNLRKEYTDENNTILKDENNAKLKVENNAKLKAENNGEEGEESALRELRELREEREALEKTVEQMNNDLLEIEAKIDDFWFKQNIGEKGKEDKKEEIVEDEKENTTSKQNIEEEKLDEMKQSYSKYYKDWKLMTEHGIKLKSLNADKADKEFLEWDDASYGKGKTKIIGADTLELLKRRDELEKQHELNNFVVYYDEMERLKKNKEDYQKKYNDCKKTHDYLIDVKWGTKGMSIPMLDPYRKVENEIVGLKNKKKELDGKVGDLEKEIGELLEKKSILVEGLEKLYKEIGPGDEKKELLDDKQNELLDDKQNELLNPIEEKKLEIKEINDLIEKKRLEKNKNKEESHNIELVLLPQKQKELDKEMPLYVKNKDKIKAAINTIDKKMSDLDKEIMKCNDDIKEYGKKQNEKKIEKEEAIEEGKAWTDDEAQLLDIIAEFVYAQNPWDMDNEQQPGMRMGAVIMKYSAFFARILTQDEDKFQKFIDGFVEKLPVDEFDEDLENIKQGVSDVLKGVRKDIKDAIENEGYGFNYASVLVGLNMQLNKPDSVLSQRLPKEEEKMRKSIHSLIVKSKEKMKAFVEDTLKFGEDNRTVIEEVADYHDENITVDERKARVEKGKVQLGKMIIESKKGVKGDLAMMKNVCSSYLSEIKCVDFSSMLASALRGMKPKKFYEVKVDEDASKETKEAARKKSKKKMIASFVGAACKGAGPLLQKMLQGIPSNLSEELDEVIDDVKSNLAPIPKAVVEAELLAMVERSDGEIGKIEVEKSLGAASVGQAFLCKVYNKKGEFIARKVVKMLRPEVRRRMLREKEIMTKCANKVSVGMGKTYRGLLEKYMEELDLTIEAANCEKGRIYNVDMATIHKKIQKGDYILNSMKISSLVQPTPHAVMIDYAEGMTADARIKEAKKLQEDLLKDCGVKDEKENGEYKKDGNGHIILDFSKIKDVAELKKKLEDELGKMTAEQIMLCELAKKWVEEGLFGKGYYHGDLHAGNILVNYNEVTVLDYGNATTMNKSQQEQVMLMVCAATAGDPAGFMEGFENLLDGDGKDSFRQKKAKFEVELDKIFNLGSYKDAGQRIAAAIGKAQELGLQLPSEIYSFQQSQDRLNYTIEAYNREISNMRNALNQLYDRVRDIQRDPNIFNWELESFVDVMSSVYEKHWKTAFLSLGPGRTLQYNKAIDKEVEWKL